MLYIIAVMPINTTSLSSDFVPLQLSLVEFLYSTITFMNGEDNMMVNVLVVVGCYMVGTKTWKAFVIFRHNHSKI